MKEGGGGEGKGRGWELGMDGRDLHCGRFLG